MRRVNPAGSKMRIGIRPVPITSKHHPAHRRLLKENASRSVDDGDSAVIEKEPVHPSATESRFSAWLSENRPSEAGAPNETAPLLTIMEQARSDRPIFSRRLEQLLKSDKDRRQIREEIDCIVTQWSLLAHDPASDVPASRLLDAGRTRIVGSSRAMTEVRSRIDKYGASHLPVFISGKPGTGKELVAREIHRLSSRRDGPFIVADFRGISAETAALLMFGDAPAFAAEAKPSLITQARGGTLFIDEVGDLPLAVQARLARLLQEEAPAPDDTSNVARADFRVIAATHQDLPKQIEQERFREDLFYSIDVCHLDLPELEARGRDIIELASHFLEKAVAGHSIGAKRLSSTASNWLLRQSFPGNVRQLRSMIDRAIVLAGDSPEVHVDHLEAKSPDGVRRSHSLAALAEHFESAVILDRYSNCGGDRQSTARQLDIPIRTLTRKLALARGLRVSYGELESLEVADLRHETLRCALERHERTLLLDCMARSAGKRARMAEHLDISLRTLHYKLKQHNLRESAPADA